MVLLTAQLIPAARLPAYIHKIIYYEKTTSILDIFCQRIAKSWKPDKPFFSGGSFPSTPRFYRITQCTWIQRPSQYNIWQEICSTICKIPTRPTSSQSIRIVGHLTVRAVDQQTTEVTFSLSPHNYLYTVPVLYCTVVKAKKISTDLKQPDVFLIVNRSPTRDGIRQNLLLFSFFW